MADLQSNAIPDMWLTAAPGANKKTEVLK